MRYIPESFLKKHLTSSSFADIQVLQLSGLEIARLEREPNSAAANPFEKCWTLNLSNNWIQPNELERVWLEFSPGWWVNLANNRLDSLDGLNFPIALGTLDLSSNAFQLENYASLSPCHILRFTVSTPTIPMSVSLTCDNELDFVLNIAKHLPNVWVVNHDFITFRERKYVLTQPTDDSQPVTAITDSTTWRSLPSTKRQESVLNILHRLQKLDATADIIRLDTLFEDYLHEVASWNTYCTALSLANNSATRTGLCKPIPEIKQLDAVFFLPHRQRLDMAVLLTTAIIFPIPTVLLTETLTILISDFVTVQDIKAIVALPSFAKSALVSMLRRVTKVEYQDYLQKQSLRLAFLKINPFHTLKWNSNFIPTFDGPYGFYFLRNIQRFVHHRFPGTDEVEVSPIPAFSELELEIMNTLPDVVNRWSAYENIPVEVSDVKVRRWVSFAARHAILLLNKCPSCPPLNDVSRSLKQQEYYLELVPLLKAASMSLVDLEIITMGPRNDGRGMRNSLKAANLPPRIAPLKGQNTRASMPAESISHYRRKLEESMRMLDGKILPFGVGLPRASSQSLRWNASEDRIRPYHKPWQSNTVYAGSTCRDGDTGNTQANTRRNEVNEEPSEGQNETFEAINTDQNNTNTNSFFMTHHSSSLHMGSPTSANGNTFNRAKSFASASQQVWRLSEEYSEKNSVMGEGNSAIKEIILDYIANPPRASSPTASSTSPSRTFSLVNMNSNLNSATPNNVPTPVNGSPTSILRKSMPQQPVWRIDTDMTDDGVALAMPELFPPEFRPHSRATSFSMPMASSGGARAGSPSSKAGGGGSRATFSPLDVNTMLLTEKSQETDYKDPSSQGKEGEQYRALKDGGLVTVGDDQQQATDDNDDLDSVKGHDSVGSRSFVSISLPSVRASEQILNDDIVVSHRSDYVEDDRFNPELSLLHLQSNNASFQAESDSIIRKMRMGDVLSVDIMSITDTKSIDSSTEPTSPQQQAHVHQGQMQQGQENKSRLHQVEVFSADSLWDPQFLVAPRQAVQSFNHHYDLFQRQVTHHHVASERYWKNINHPPIVLIEPHKPKMSTTPRTVFLHSSTFKPNSRRSYQRSLMQKSMLSGQMVLSPVKEGFYEDNEEMYLLDDPHGFSPPPPPPPPPPLNDTQEAFDPQDEVGSPTFTDRISTADSKEQEQEQEDNVSIDDSSIAFSEMTQSVRVAEIQENGDLLSPLLVYSKPPTPAAVGTAEAVNGIQQQQTRLQSPSVVAAVAISIPNMSMASPATRSPAIRRRLTSTDCNNNANPLLMQALNFSNSGRNSANNNKKRSLSIPSSSRRSFSRPVSGKMPFQTDIAEIDDDIYAQAANELLKDLGTINNMRKMEEFNDYLFSLKLDAEGRAVSERKDDSLEGEPIFDVSEQLSASRPQLSRMTSSSRHSSTSMISNTGEDDEIVYINSTSRHESERAMGIVPDAAVEVDDERGNGNETFFTGTGYEETMPLQLAPQELSISINDQEQQQLQMSPPRSPYNLQRDMTHIIVPKSHVHQRVETIRQEHPQCQIYTEELHIDHTSASHAINGTRVGFDFYPVYPKIVYRMEDEPAAIGGQARSSNKLNNNAANKGKKTIKKSLQPTLFDNSTMSSAHTFMSETHNDHASGSSTADQIPTATTTHSIEKIEAHNLQLLKNSHGIFKDVLRTSFTPMKEVSIYEGGNQNGTIETAPSRSLDEQLSLISSLGDYNHNNKDAHNNQMQGFNLSLTGVGASLSLANLSRIRTMSSSSQHRPNSTTEIVRDLRSSALSSPSPPPPNNKFGRAAVMSMSKHARADDLDLDSIFSRSSTAESSVLEDQQAKMVYEAYGGPHLTIPSPDGYSKPTLGLNRSGSNSPSERRRKKMLLSPIMKTTVMTKSIELFTGNDDKERMKGSNHRQALQQASMSPSEKREATRKNLRHHNNGILSQSLPTLQVAVKPHRRLRTMAAINPINDKVWVGQQNYKAATTRLELNRSFKFKVPIQKGLLQPTISQVLANNNRTENS